LCGQFITYPLDVVRRRMQIERVVDGKVRSFSAVFRHLVATEGWKGTSKAFSLNIIKGPITLSLSLTSYDMLRAYFKENVENNEEDVIGGGGK
jgi:hypothetical protein